MAKRKSSAAIVQERVLFILPLISTRNRRSILQYVRKNTKWDVSVKQIDNYIAKANILMKEQREDIKENIQEAALNNLMNLYQEAHEEKDFKTCLAIQKEINDLFGLKVTKVKDVTERNPIDDLFNKLDNM